MCLLVNRKQEKEREVFNRSTIFISCHTYMYVWSMNTCSV